MSWFYYTGRAMTSALLFLFTDCEVKGRENIPLEGPLLVVSNHLHNADPALLGVVLRRGVVFMAKEELFRNRLAAYFIRNFGAFPVRRGLADRAALRYVEEALAAGLALVMFPEGKRSGGKGLQPALPGSALIAARHDVPIIPVGITGTEKISGPVWWARRPRIRVNIGPPLNLPAGRQTREERQKHTELIMRRIAGLLPPAYRGIYA